MVLRQLAETVGPVSIRRSLARLLGFLAVVVRGLWSQPVQAQEAAGMAGRVVRVFRLKAQLIAAAVVAVLTRER
jgi:hypothetical protein